VKHAMLRGATHVRSRNRLARSRGVKLHDHRTPSRLVPLSAPTFSTCLGQITAERSGERRRHAGGRHPWHLCGFALPDTPLCLWVSSCRCSLANKAKALSAPSGD
jgi:hypothetical protein